MRRQRSAERRAFDAELREVTPRLAIRSRGQCQVYLEGCTGRATVVHHRKLRSQGGTNDLNSLLHLCDSCHREVHKNTGSSYESGFLVRSWADPEEVPVLVTGRVGG